jgi:hypothetical protein
MKTHEVGGELNVATAQRLFRRPIKLSQGTGCKLTAGFLYSTGDSFLHHHDQNGFRAVKREADYFLPSSEEFRKHVALEYVHGLMVQNVII